MSDVTSSMNAASYVTHAYRSAQIEVSVRCNGLFAKCSLLKELPSQVDHLDGCVQPIESRLRLDVRGLRLGAIFRGSVGNLAAFSSRPVHSVLYKVGLKVD